MAILFGYFLTSLPAIVVAPFLAWGVAALLLKWCDAYSARKYGDLTIPTWVNGD